MVLDVYSLAYIFHLTHPFLLSSVFCPLHSLEIILYTFPPSTSRYRYRTERYRSEAKHPRNYLHFYDRLSSLQPLVVFLGHSTLRMRSLPSGVTFVYHPGP